MPDRPIEIRTARADDAGPIARLHIESWRATYTRELSAGYLAGQDPVTHAERWRRRMAEGMLVLIAVRGDDLDGFVASGPAQGSAGASGEWEIYNLHVAPALKGRGVGSLLFEEAARRGRESGARELVLWVVETNANARAFYERRGMRPDGARQEHGVGAGETLIEVRYLSPLRRV